jgi:hypothetical protein
MFEPRTELEPAGLGPEKHDETIVLANVQYLLSLGNVLGTVQVSGAYVYQARKLTWHRQYRLELHIDSTLKGESHQRYTATAKGGADIWDQGTGLLRGDGELEVRTRPGRADGCRGETSYKGSGTYDLEVVFASVDARNQLVLVGIDSGPEEESPDTVTFEGCGPVKRWTGTFNTWENNFMLANQEDLRPGQGILLSGWDWKATDSTWTSGGLVASLTRNEKCPASLCSGKTKYELHAYPIE